MAWFQMPANAIQGDYGVVSPDDARSKNLVPNSVWKLTIPLGGSADILFVDGGGLTLTSNAPAIVTNPIPETAIGNIRTLTIFGATVGSTMIFASTAPGNGSLPLQVEVTASQPLTLKAGLVLDQPSMALNAHDTPATYSMQYKFVINPTESAQDIIGRIKAKAPLKHVAISTHAYVSRQGETSLTIGKGFDSSNTNLFSQLNRQVGVLWLCGCAAGASAQGHADCKARSIAAACYVVAPTMFMSNPPGTKGILHLSKGMIDMNARFMPVVFAPPFGTLIAWPTFLGLGSQLGFKV